MQGFRGFVFCVVTVAFVVPALAQFNGNDQTQAGQNNVTENRDSSYSAVGLPKSNACQNMTEEQCKAATQANDQP